jgi:cell division protein FtsZ
MSDNMKDYRFDLPKNQKSIIKVIGVGGGGSNAVNHMYGLGIKDVEFVVVNTDAQALKSSPVPLRLQLGANLTEGLGAGANPEQGKCAALESEDEIRELLCGYGWWYRNWCGTNRSQNC